MYIVSALIVPICTTNLPSGPNKEIQVFSQEVWDFFWHALIRISLMSLVLVLFVTRR